MLAEDEWRRVIGFDEPFGERLVARFVESRNVMTALENAVSRRAADGERCFAEGGGP